MKKILKRQVERLVENAVREMAKDRFEYKLFEDSKRRANLRLNLNEGADSMKKFPISALHNVFAYFDASNSTLVEFFDRFKESLGYTMSEDRSRGLDPIRPISGFDSQQRTDKWSYRFGDSRIEVESFINGKGFLGVDYYITEMTSTADVMGFDSPWTTEEDDDD